MESTSIFISQSLQAVRLPKAVEMPESVKRVDIIPLGRGRLIVPEGEGWDSWFDGECVTSDFLSERAQPKNQNRQSF